MSDAEMTTEEEVRPARDNTAAMENVRLFRDIMVPILLTAGGMFVLTNIYVFSGLEAKPGFAIGQPYFGHTCNFSVVLLGYLSIRWVRRRHGDDFPSSCFGQVSRRMVGVAVLSGVLLALVYAVKRVLFEVPPRYYSHYDFNLNIVYDLVAAPLFEEIAYRRILFGWMARISTPRIAVFMSAAVFTLVHGLRFNSLASGIVWVASSMIFGMAAAMMYWRTGSLMPSVIMHAIYNFVLTVADMLAIALRGW